MITTTHAAVPASGGFKIPAMLSRKVSSRPAPEVRRVSVDGQRALAVKLSGKLGEDWEALIDPEVYEEISKAFGGRWFLQGPSVPQAFVAVANVAARKATGSKGNAVAVARLIAQQHEPISGKLVVHLNALHLDLRRANLRVVDRADGERYRGAMPLPVVRDGWDE
jgi:hypothetical protein